MAEQNAAPSPALSTLDPRLARLAETAKNYARAARSENTARAYDADWRQLASWLRRNGFDELPPEPQTLGLYLAAQAETGVSVATLERRLSGICWRYRQLGQPLDASDRHISTGRPARPSGASGFRSRTRSAPQAQREVPRRGPLDEKIGRSRPQRRVGERAEHQSDGERGAERHEEGRARRAREQKCDRAERPEKARGNPGAHGEQRA